MPQIQRETGTSLSEINMVPFIDVVLVLLIIFMITAPILQSGIDVDVPKTKTVKELTQVRMVVTHRPRPARLSERQAGQHPRNRATGRRRSRTIRRIRPSMFAATKRCRSEAGRPSWTRCARPAFRISAWSRNRSASARKHSEMSVHRRNPHRTLSLKRFV